MSKNNDQTIEKIIRLMQTDDSIDAPEDSVRWAKNLFKTRIAQPQTSVFKKVLAVLQMDLAPHQAAYGERSVGSAQSRQMLFQAGENALDIRINKTELGFDIYGQILGEGFENGTVKAGSFETNINELGEFKLFGLPGGEYSLSVRNNENEIAVEILSLT